jgi:hypothetical protein
MAVKFAHCETCHGAGCWWHLDGEIARELEDAGFAPHVHGDVPHHHDYRAIGIIPMEGVVSHFSWTAGEEPVQEFFPTR